MNSIKETAATLAGWFQGQCKELRCCTRFDKNSCLMTGIRKVGRSGIDQEIRGCSEAVHASFLHGRILFRILGKVRNWNRSNQFSRAVSDFSWKWRSATLMGVCKVIFLLNHREGPERLPPILSSGKASSTANISSASRVPFCFNEDRTPTVCRFIRKD